MQILHLHLDCVVQLLLYVFLDCFLDYKLLLVHDAHGGRLRRRAILVIARMKVVLVGIGTRVFLSLRFAHCAICCWLPNACRFPLHALLFQTLLLFLLLQIPHLMPISQRAIVAIIYGRRMSGLAHKPCPVLIIISNITQIRNVRFVYFNTLLD